MTYHPHLVRRLLCWTPAFIAAAYLGRATIIDGRALSLVWPAAGVAALWFASGSRDTWRYDAVALSAATVLVNVTTGASLQLVAVFVAANLLQVFAFVTLLRLLLQRLRGPGQRDPSSGLPGIERVAELGGIAAAATASSLLAALLGWGGLRWALHHADVALFLAWWGRNSVGIIVIATLGATAAASLRRAGDAGRSGPAAPRRFRLGLQRPVELVGHLLLTGGLCWAVFSFGGQHPMVFVLMATTVLMGLRFGPLVVGLHGLLVGVLAVTLTLQGHGPFAAIGDVYWRALSAQVFVALTCLTGLVLAVHRQERETLVGQLHQSQQEAAERAAMLDAVLHNMHEGVAVVDAEGNVLLRNRAGRTLMGLQGAPTTRIMSADQYRLRRPDGTPVGEADLPYAKALASGETVREDLLVPGPGPEDRRTLEMTARTLPDLTLDGVPQVIVTYRDVSAERAERDDLASFAGMVAHDLSNPLSAIQGWAELLELDLTTDTADTADTRGDEAGTVSTDDGERARQRSYVARISVASLRMRRLIDDLLAYTITRDRPLTLTDLDISAMALETVSVHSQTLDLPPLVNIEPGLHVRGDEVLFRQVLDNLISNAVKYVAPGVRPEVTIQGATAGLDGGGVGDLVAISVIDNGIGVPAEHRQRIFDNFHRLRADDYRGTGLGLAICRRAIERHGGTLTITDAPDGAGEPTNAGTTSGSMFTVTLPSTTAPLHPPRTRTSHPVPTPPRP